MMQEWISKAWLLQNTHNGMSVMELLQAYIDAPVVEFDTDEPPRHGRCRSCKHYFGSPDGDGGPCKYWPGFVGGDDWCSNYGKERRADDEGRDD